MKFFFRTLKLWSLGCLTLLFFSVFLSVSSVDEGNQGSKEAETHIEAGSLKDQLKIPPGYYLIDRRIPEKPKIMFEDYVKGKKQVGLKTEIVDKVTMPGLGTISHETSPSQSSDRCQEVVVVWKDVYNNPDLGGRVDRYVLDVALQSGCEVDLMVAGPKGDVKQGETLVANPEDLRNSLHNLYTQSKGKLLGGVFIGPLPVAWFEASDDYYHGSFPTDYFYMNLNGTWIEDTGPGLYKEIQGDVYPQIFISRIDASSLESPKMNQFQWLQVYLDRTHEYYEGRLVPTQTAAEFVDAGAGYDIGSELGMGVFLAYPQRKVYTHPDELTKKTFLNTLNQERYESVWVLAHADQEEIDFMDSERITPGDIDGTPPNALMYNFVSCNVARFTEPNFIAGHFLFNGGSSSLIVQGATAIDETPRWNYSYKSDGFIQEVGMIPNYPLFYKALSQKESVGEAFKDFLSQQIQDEKGSPWIIGIMSRRILLGDPFIKPVKTSSVSSSQPIQASLETDKEIYRVGETVSVHLKTEVPVDTGATYKVSLLPCWKSQSNKNSYCNPPFITAQGPITQPLTLTIPSSFISSSGNTMDHITLIATIGNDYYLGGTNEKRIFPFPFHLVLDTSSSNVSDVGGTTLKLGDKAHIKVKGTDQNDQDIPIDTADIIIYSCTKGGVCKNVFDLHLKAKSSKTEPSELELTYPLDDFSLLNGKFEVTSFTQDKQYPTAGAYSMDIFASSIKPFDGPPATRRFVFTFQ